MERVIWVPALGAMVLTKMLFFFPSRARARPKPRIPAFCNGSVFGIQTRRLLKTYRGGIICLSKIAIDTGGAGRIDDPAVFLLDHIGVSGFGAFVGSPQVNIQDRVPEFIGHVGESLVSQD